MTDITLDRTVPQAAAPAPIFTRRIHALLRLLRINRRRDTLASALAFADPRMQQDLGLRRDHHRDDWLTAFLGR